MPMRFVFYVLPILLLSVSLCGCSSNKAADSKPPPGVRKNEKRNSGDPARKAKSLLLDAKKETP
jgi:hypothetical protein